MPPRLLLLFSLASALGLGCRRVPQADDSDSHSVPGDTHDSLPADSQAETGDTGASETTVAFGRLANGHRWWVVTLDVEQRSTAVVVAPPEGGSGRYDDGAPVVLAAGQGMASEVGCDDDPDRLIRSNSGAVLVQFMMPGQCCMGVCGGTPDDIGGAVSRQAFDDLRDFALDQASTLQGRTLDSLVELPLLNERLVVLLSSSRAAPALMAMAANPDDYGAVGAIVQYEPPYYPAMVGLELGNPLMDPDPSVDADGNQFEADDGRYPHYQVGDCRKGRCVLDHVPLGWAPDVAIRDVHFEVSGKVTAQRDRPGVLYADGNGNGSLDLDGTQLDIDGDGLVESDEDFVFFGMIQDGNIEDEVYWHSPELLEAALEQGVLTEDAWPEHFPALDHVERFWGERDHPAAQAQVASALPDVYWIVLAGWFDHAQAQPSRPHIVALYNDLRALGAQVQFNPATEILEEVDGPLPSPYDEVAEGAPTDEATILGHLVSHGVGMAVIRTAGVLQASDRVWADQAR